MVRTAHDMVFITDAQQPPAIRAFHLGVLALQTVLTLLQSAAVVPADARGTASVLGVCLQLFSNRRISPCFIMPPSSPSMRRAGGQLLLDGLL